ncbi:MAG: FAD-dependent oxidoreductase [Proteobacteria bacterium]|nr:FAD-dependent oxidoreductase [Pseudomonadota bacterium]
MHVAVLGAGVTGVTTAYYLAEFGHTVTVIERASAVATETSFANGAQLSYSYTDSLANPAFIPKIPSLLLGLDPAIRIRIMRNFSMFPWGLRFLAQCTRAKAGENTIAVLKIALRSAELLEQLHQKLSLQFSYAAAGKLVLLASPRDVEAAKLQSALKRQLGCETHVLNPDEAIVKEPALAFMRQDFAGAVYAEHDHVGDAHAFTRGLSDWLQSNRSVEFDFDRDISGLNVNEGRFLGVQTGTGTIHADAAVVCLGPWSQQLLTPHGINPMLYPVRGYSVTLPPGPHAPTVSITSLRHRIVYSHFDDKVRIAGFADFVGFNTSRDAERISLMCEIAKQAAPEAADYDAKSIRPWGGFRPVTPSGQPNVGPSGIDGLFVNTGHGSLGWTVACATAESAAQAVTNSE